MAHTAVPVSPVGTRTVPSAVFTEAMSRHWREGFDNVTNPALLAVWRQMAEVFNAQIQSHGTRTEDRWQVVQAPTGTGKTQGLAVYCSLLPEIEHPGVLIVTRLKIQADEIAATINRLTGRTDALAYHGDAVVPVATFQQYPVLVITHRAYEIGLDKVNQGHEITSNWQHYHHWSLTGRRLVVIDEALDIVEEAQVDLERVKLVRALIPEPIAQQYPHQMKTLAVVEDVLRQMARVVTERKQPEFERVVWQGEMRLPADSDMTPLRRELRNIRLDRSLRIKDPEQQKRATASLDTILRDVQATLDNWNWYARKLQDHTLNTARLIVPDSIKGAVVLDATASSDVVYQLFEKAEVIPLPAQPRTYRNVTVHVSRGHALGHTFMDRNAEEVSANLVENLKASLPSTRKVFVVTHVNVEPLLVKYRDASGFAAFDVGHYGALDGRNDWSAFDTAVIFGLPFRDKAWSANTFMALRGLQTTAWLNADGDRPFQAYKDIRAALDDSKLIVAVVQAINRIRCRRVVSADGDCPPVDVFLLLPPGALGEKILEGIRQEMPAIVAKEWPYDHLKRARAGRKASAGEALRRYANTMLPGKHSASEVRTHLRISPRQWDRMAAAMKHESSEYARTLAALGVRYSIEGAGRGARSWLIKQ
jgi:hypothetical protein